jgi:hypothetical protein
VGEVRNEIDGSTVEYDFFEPIEGVLVPLLTALFERHWREIRFGPCIQGAVYELTLSAPARVSMLDGYLTVESGAWHLHLCVGEHRGTTMEARQVRRAAKSAFFRSRSVTCSGGSYGLRLWNGAGEQMITVFFPSPWLDDDLRLRKEPDWSRLALWRELRAAYANVTD